MGDLTKNISRHEVACKCGKCEFRIQDHESIINMVQAVCDRVAIMKQTDKVQLEITSAARCYNHNKAIGSNDESQHLRCTAMDFKIFAHDVQVKPSVITAVLDLWFHHEGGAGEYETFNHADMRGVRTRWKG